MRNITNEITTMNNRLTFFQDNTIYIFYFCTLAEVQSQFYIGLDSFLTAFSSQFHMQLWLKSVQQLTCSTSVAFTYFIEIQGFQNKYTVGVFFFNSAYNCYVMS